MDRHSSEKCRGNPASSEETLNEPRPPEDPLDKLALCDQSPSTKESLDKETPSASYSTFASPEVGGQDPGVEKQKGNSTYRKRLLILLISTILCLICIAIITCFAVIATRNSLHETKRPSADFKSVTGPVIRKNFPDPAIIYDNGVSYAFATNNRGAGSALRRVQMAKSTDNVTWTILDQDALPEIGAWEKGTGVWAPDVVRLANGSFVLYYSDAPSSAPSHHCVGAATSDNITGPYRPLDKPFVCPDVHTLGGAIDPEGFLDESTNKRYVAYKVDGNSIGHGGVCKNGIAPLVPTPILLQEVAEDGITKIGDPVQILDRSEKDGPLIEAPALARSDEGIYFLFYSSNCFTTPLYDVAYATALNVTGPYTRADEPLLLTGDVPNLVGPGGMDVIKNGNMVVFHGHMTPRNSGKDATKFAGWVVRGMYTAKLAFSGRKCSLAGE